MKLTTFTEDVYLPTVKNQVRLNTYVGYEGSYYKYIKPWFKDYDINDVNAFEIQKFVDHFDKPGSARRCFSTLRQIIHLAQDCEVYVKKDPTKKHIKLPKTAGNTSKVLTYDEVSTLLNGFKDHPLEACVICSVTLGLRRCESFGLKWSDINFKTGEVHIHRSRQIVKGKEVVYPPKTKLSERTCYLPSFALKRLKQIQKDGNNWLLPVPVNKAPGMYRKFIEDNNLPYTPFMNLRHTWATLQIESGTDVVLVAKMMGHTDIDMAYKRYVRPSKQSFINVQHNFNNNVTQVSHRRSIKSMLKNLFYSSVLSSLVASFLPYQGQ